MERGHAVDEDGTSLSLIPVEWHPMQQEYFLVI